MVECRYTQKAILNRAFLKLQCNAHLELIFVFRLKKQKGKKDKVNMQDNKVKYWGMRTSKKDREQIDNLAKRLRVKKSEAVRRAVAFLLAEKSKTAQAVN